MYTIYALVDPRDNIPRYVGLTDCPPFRLREHIRNLDGGKEKRAWVRELWQHGLVPSMEVLETTSTLESAHQRTKHALREQGYPTSQRTAGRSAARMGDHHGGGPALRCEC